MTITTANGTACPVCESPGTCRHGIGDDGLAEFYCYNRNGERQGDFTRFGDAGMDGAATTYVRSADGVRRTPADVLGRPARPEIVITTEEMRVNDRAVESLAGDPELFQRDGSLVRVAWDAKADRGISRPVAPRIEQLPEPTLRERLTSVATWSAFVVGKNGEPRQVKARPPSWCVRAVAARGSWDGIRYLHGVVEYPVIRPDGSLLSKPGYDEATGLLLAPSGPLPPVAPRPTRAMALAAVSAVEDVIADFPFEHEGHRAAYFAALLTPLARFAFPGPAPLFLVDANVRGAGKGLLLNTISTIITGQTFTVTTYSHEVEELRKRITSLVMEGDRLVLFDNLEGKFGNAALDAALTSTSWKDRVLGANKQYAGEIVCTWYATGNNVQVGADTARRVCHVRLESGHERPEERTGLRYPDLMGHVRAYRLHLLGAALTILRGYFEAGQPDQSLTPWGSFEGWSRLVRNAVVWAGLGDPYESRKLLQATSDVVGTNMQTLLGGMRQMGAQGKGLTASEIVKRLQHPPAVEPDYYHDVRDAIESLSGKLDGRSLGYKLREYRRRIFGGLFLDHASGKKGDGTRWVVLEESQFNASRGPSEGRGGDGGDGGDDSSYADVGIGGEVPY